MGLTNPLTLDTDPSQTVPWGELVRATATDGFLVPPLHHDGPVHAANFDAKGERVVTASRETARIWQPAGERVVTASVVTARIWDARTGEPIGKPLQDFDAFAVPHATLDTKGDRMVTTLGKTARIWDARTGIGKPLHHDDRVVAATFDAAGERVVTASDDKTARIWDAPSGGQALLDHVRAKLGQNAPDPLKVPDQTPSLISVIGRGFTTMWTRLTAALPPAIKFGRIDIPL
jgi:WD40 repeat protein